MHRISTYFEHNEHCQEPGRSMLIHTSVILEISQQYLSPWEVDNHAYHLLTEPQVQSFS